MSYSRKKCDVEKRPNLTESMRKKDQVYIWKMIKNNPNLYCWIPIKNKYVVTEGISLEDVKIVNIPPPAENNESLQKATEFADKARKKYLSKKLKDGTDVVSYDDSKKYIVVKKFIKDKGLILYGGLAINASLPRNEKIYKPTAIPDYDIFSTDPWKDAIELANRLYKAGYEYSEIRGGIHKGTYKVFANMWPVADITYLPEDDFNKLQTRNWRGLKMISNPKIMADIFRQLTSLGDLYRWDKVYKRQKLYQKWNQPLGKSFTCKKDIFMGSKTKISDKQLILLDKCQKFIKQKKLLYSGSLAYNTYISLGGGTERLLVDHFEVMSENAKEDTDELFNFLAQGENSPLFNIKVLDIDIRHQTGKPGNNFSYTIAHDGQPVCVITQLTNCIGYKYLNGKYIVGIDFMKWMLYTDLAYATGKEANRLKCLIKYITDTQNNYYKKKKINDLDNSPFQRLIKNCRGPLEEGIKVVFLQKWLDRIEGRVNVKVVKPRTDTIILKNVKGTTIRIFPKTKQENECNKLNEEQCKYPCNWKEYNKKCYPVPSGIYRVGDPLIEPIEEVPIEEGIYPAYN